MLSSQSLIRPYMMTIQSWPELGQGSWAFAASYQSVIGWGPPQEGSVTFRRLAEPPHVAGSWGPSVGAFPTSRRVSPSFSEGAHVVHPPQDEFAICNSPCPGLLSTQVGTNGHAGPASHQWQGNIKTFYTLYKVFTTISAVTICHRINVESLCYTWN